MYIYWYRVSYISFLLMMMTGGCLMAADKYFTSQLVLGTSPILEPYRPLHGGGFIGAAVPLSPDPLVRYRWRDTKFGRSLQYYLLRPIGVSTPTPSAFKHIHSALTNSCNITVDGTGKIRFDFGTESAAWLEFDSPDLHGQVQAAVSEFHSSAVEGCMAKPQKIGDTYRLKLNKDFYEGVRFGWIYIRSFNGKPWHITHVRLVCQIKPVNYNGGFSCSDPMLTRIWYTGAYTVKIALLKNYFGTILMDRGDRSPWIGDEHIAQATAMVAFGNWRFIRNNINALARNNNMNIASYQMYWILSLVDYYMYTGDRSELLRNIPMVEAKLARGNAMFKKPQINFYGWDYRLGSFTHPQIHEAVEAYRMLFIGTCQRFAAVLSMAGYRDLAAKYRNLAAIRTAEIAESPNWVRHVGVFAASDAINAGVPDRLEDRYLYRHIFADPVTRLSLSPFNEYFIIRAMGKMEWTAQALQTVLEDWGGQIRHGGTTFFECYLPSWNVVTPKNGILPLGAWSWCHPWSSGCTPWLTEYVAGIKPTTPGYANVDIQPHFGKLLTYVSSFVPTPHGKIYVMFNFKQGLADVRIPSGVMACIAVPKDGRSITSIRVNGYLAWNGSFHAVPGIRTAQANQRVVNFFGVQTGHYRFTIRYKGKLPAYVAQPVVYSVRVLGQDDKTRGNWGGVYGRDGYILFNYNGVGKNRELLPSYVKSVTCSKGKNFEFPAAKNNISVLAPNTTNTGPRNMGVYFGNSVIIHLKHPVNYQLALYAVDFNRQQLENSVELLNLHTLVDAAPVQVMRNLKHGKYLVYGCHSSVRIQLLPFHGAAGVLSGIFFDPPGNLKHP